MPNSGKATNLIGHSLYCPLCRNRLDEAIDGYSCQHCMRLYPIVDGIPSFVDQSVTVDSYDASVFELSFKMERKHFWHIGRKEIILDILKRNTSHLMGCRMLEVGCGNGSILTYLKQNGVDIEGGDIFAEGLKCCQQNNSLIKLYQLDILALPFSDDYDIIGSFDVLEHLDQDEKALAEINRALRPGGKLIITVPAFRFLWSYFDERSKHKRRYSKKEIIAKLERNGFRIKKITYYMFFLLPLTFTFRVINNAFRGEVEQANMEASVEIKAIPVVNKLFLGLLKLEKVLLRWTNLPFGTSILVLAEKK